MSETEMMQYALSLLGIISPFLLIVLSTVYADELIKLLRRAVKISMRSEDY